MKNNYSGVCGVTIISTNMEVYITKITHSVLNVWSTVPIHVRWVLQQVLHWSSNLQETLLFLETAAEPGLLLISVYVKGISTSNWLEEASWWLLWKQVRLLYGVSNFHYFSLLNYRCFSPANTPNLQKKEQGIYNNWLWQETFLLKLFFIAAYGKAVLQMSSLETVCFKRKEILFAKSEYEK